MSEERLTAGLACRILGWPAPPDRFIKAGRKWLQRWGFTPLTKLEDAFDLLDHAPTSYALTTNGCGSFKAEVRGGGHAGKP